MDPLRISELLPNPPGTDRGNEWVELCASRPLSLSGYALRVGTRTLPLSGAMPATCRIVRTGTAAITNREATVSLLRRGSAIQTVRTAGTAPEGYGYHVSESPYWASSTPGIAAVSDPGVPPLPALGSDSPVPELAGTAACTAGILTALALAALRYARDRHHALQGRDAAPRR